MGSGLWSICVAYQRGVLIMESRLRSVIVAYQSRHVGQGVVGQGVSAWCIDHGEWAKEYLHGVSAWCISYGDVGLGVGVVGQRVVVQGVSAWRVCVEY